jgi:pimeloyl-ACP methyl ester carboxylesterase
MAMDIRMALTGPGPFAAGPGGWLLSVLVLLSLLGGCTPYPGDSEAALALEDLAGGVMPSRLAGQTPAPLRDTVRYATALGVVAVARTLARLRFAVLVPDMPGVRQYRVRDTDVLEVAGAFAWLTAQPALAPEGRAGMAGFSYGAGPVLVAAMQPDIHRQVRFVMSVGGYFDLQNVICYFTTGHAYTGATPAAGDRPDAGLRPPHPYGQALFIRSNLDLLERGVDRGFLRSYADYLVGSDTELDEPVPGTLAPDALALYRLLVNHDPAAVPGLIANLPGQIRELLAGINPAGQDLSRLQAHLILLHGRSDNLIPYTESVALSRALPPGQARLFLIDGLAHVDLKPKAHDLPQLIAAMEALLAERADEVSVTDSN